MKKNALTLSIATILGAVTLAATSAHADYPKFAPYVGAFGGGVVPLSDWNLRAVGVTELPQASPMFGARLGFHILPRLGVEGEFAYIPLSSTNGGSNSAYAYGINGIFHILASDWTPYGTIGYGGYTTGGGPLGSDTDARGHFGVGMRGLVLPWMALRAEVRDVITDGVGTGASNRIGGNNLEMHLGLDIFLATGAGDRDKDGIPDSQDKCPDLPGVASAKGCPDRDGDTVPDALDRCPDTPGKPELDGCPDRDGDGIADAQDACPDVPGVKSDDPKKNGCPADRDGDGIGDAQDACPDVPGVKSDDPKKNGCPVDRDGDGIGDAQDACPDVPGVKSDDPKKNGCPLDTDGDGIVDAQDACPNDPGPSNPDPKKNGCPSVSVQGSQIVILEQVKFRTGSAEILPESAGILDAVSKALKDHPEIGKLRVEGHTDNQGAAAGNKWLSQRRAASVVAALVKRGVEAARLTPQGFGQERPIDTNATEPGRQNNRRVEFHIVPMTP